MPSFYALVIGASSTIAQAAIQQFEADKDCLGVFAISRSLPNSETATKTQWLESDYSEDSIQQICKSLASYSGKISKVLICNGILHNDSMMPERKLEEIRASQLEAIFHTNTIIPMLWLSQLLPILQGEQVTQVALFSARIGSISDNKTGGWYSYRASKAALNMLIQTSSVEYARRAKNVKLIAFHPGTTDTPLSKPFQRSVPKDKLFTADFVATQLLSIMENVTMDNKAAYLDWNNQPIEW
ncbi:NAD(P)-dependent dehydrogenase, short-chain alcohol dehydrogenase family [Marinomonas polaris DSM 16579]|uniref:NAD(P)-dependent dehydrogenase, short-chain alcohol dehydrogenase family n=1 Tax=Marinomonas polaris DSM 16579 TaxID=1122206 RepID=A0A1M5FHN6_9GAMM|nr:SDR family NAD(P)-dependent oxidoreductase [Marinomonas polaris]SHF90939.1 NAD(P)-dependent dehydrogenase, short-chain alcohol dehydrogenase family [Marinomonas polaris DSM 16579]